jgi:hypothetical protein
LDESRPEKVAPPLARFHRYFAGKLRAVHRKSRMELIHLMPLNSTPATKARG